jgi:hypothetical protein
VTAYWLEGEAAARGLVVSQAEVEANLRRLLSSPAGPALAAGLARRHMSQADELLVLRLDSLAQKLRAQIEAGGDAATRNARVRGFIAAYHQRWRQRTSCAPAYVIAQCRESPAGRAP